MMKSIPTDYEPVRERIFILNETIIRTSPTLACEIGHNESMILLQLDFWISISNNYYDGRFWTYQSVRDMKKKAFPFWSIATINRTIGKLLAKEYVIEGNYNKHKYDKTRWFALNSDKLSELQSIAIRKLQTQLGHDAAQNDTRPAQNDTTIPENPTENTTENNKPLCDFSKKQKKHDNQKKKFITFRKQLKKDKLQAFELVADNLEKVIGKTLLEFVEQSPESVKSAYQEMVDRDKKHFSYFTKIFFSHLTKQKKAPVGRELTPEEIVEIDKIMQEEY